MPSSNFCRNRGERASGKEPLMAGTMSVFGNERLYLFSAVFSKGSDSHSKPCELALGLGNN